jgi:hypothetical protein
MLRILASTVATVGCLLVAPASFAAPLLFKATLSGPNENPANNSPGTGTALVFLNIDANIIAFNVDFSGLFPTLADGVTPSGTTAAHIHCCNPEPANSPVVVTSHPFIPGFPLNVTAGTFMGSFDTENPDTYRPAFIAANGGTVQGAELALQAGLLAGNQAYFNIHTNRFGGGEIRGFLAAVPEPGSMALMGLGLLGLAGLRRKSA